MRVVDADELEARAPELDRASGVVEVEPAELVDEEALEGRGVEPVGVLGRVRAGRRSSRASSSDPARSSRSTPWTNAPGVPYSRNGANARRTPSRPSRCPSRSPVADDEVGLRDRRDPREPVLLLVLPAAPCGGSPQVEDRDRPCAGAGGSERSPGGSGKAIALDEGAPRECRDAGRRDDAERRCRRRACPCSPRARHHVGVGPGVGGGGVCTRPGSSRRARRRAPPPRRSPAGSRRPVSASRSCGRRRRGRRAPPLRGRQAPAGSPKGKTAPRRPRCSSHSRGSSRRRETVMPTTFGTTVMFCRLCRILIIAPAPTGASAAGSWAATVPLGWSESISPPYSTPKPRSCSSFVACPSVRPMFDTFGAALRPPVSVLARRARGRPRRRISRSRRS